jgi:hypothetical protein
MSDGWAPEAASEEATETSMKENMQMRTTIIARTWNGMESNNWQQQQLLLLRPVT